jgi:hypothetical protein
MTEKPPSKGKRSRSRTLQRGDAAPEAPPPRPHRLAPLAVAAFILLVYGFYYLNRLPEARPIAGGTRWQVEAGEQLRLQGVKAGTVLQLNFSETAAAKLSFPQGTRRLPDPVAGDPGSVAATGLELGLFNAQKENAEIRVSVEPEGKARATLLLEPHQPDPRLRSLTLFSEDSALRVDLSVIPNPDAAEHGQIQIGNDVVEEAALRVPRGQRFTIGVRADQLGGLRKEVGEYVDGSQKLDVEAVEIGTPFEGEFERRAMACGAARGKILWQRLVPGLAPRDCRAGRVTVTGFDLAGGVQLVLQGTGYIVKEGKTETWQGFRDLWQNDGVKLLMGPIMAGLGAWILYVLRNLAFIRFLRRSFGRGEP